MYLLKRTDRASYQIIFGRETDSDAPRIELFAEEGQTLVEFTIWRQLPDDYDGMTLSARINYPEDPPFFHNKILDGSLTGEEASHIIRESAKNLGLMVPDFQTLIGD